MYQVLWVRCTRGNGVSSLADRGRDTDTPSTLATLYGAMWHSSRMHEPCHVRDPATRCAGTARGPTRMPARYAVMGNVFINYRHDALSI